MAEILIVYWSKAGQTAAVAERVGQSLRNLGHRVVLSVGNEEAVAPEGFGAVVVCAAVYGGRHPKALRRWLDTHREAMNRLPTAFFSLSLSAAGDQQSDQRAAERMLASLLEQTQWRPRVAASVAGAVHYGRYGLLTRWIMRAIIRRKDPAAAELEDHEYTDWEAVQRYAAEFAAAL